jgi:hypothetical protein
MTTLTASTFSFLEQVNARSGAGAFRALAGALTSGTLIDMGDCDFPGQVEAKPSSWEPIRRDGELAREIQMVMGT